MQNAGFQNHHEKPENCLGSGGGPCNKFPRGRDTLSHRGNPLEIKTPPRLHLKGGKTAPASRSPSSGQQPEDPVPSHTGVTTLLHAGGILAPLLCLSIMFFRNKRNTCLIEALEHTAITMVNQLRVHWWVSLHQHVRQHAGPPASCSPLSLFPSSKEFGNESHQSLLTKLLTNLLLV